MGTDAGCEKLPRRARRRLLAITADPGLVTRLAGAYGMLLHLIRAWGDEDGCVVNYREVAEACGASHAAVKVWARKLTDEGLIGKESPGQRGVRITLRGRALEEYESSNEQGRGLEETKTELDAAVITMGSTLKILSGRLAEFIEQHG